ncbi:hypothetical protein MPER_06269, partial [Moniliophthora perniciosa FA553]
MLDYSRLLLIGLLFVQTFQAGATLSCRCTNANGNQLNAITAAACDTVKSQNPNIADDGITITTGSNGKLKTCVLKDINPGTDWQNRQWGQAICPHVKVPGVREKAAGGHCWTYISY